MRTQPRLEKIPKAASRMGVSPSQVYREIKANRVGPLVNVGVFATAVPSDSVDNWIADRIAEAKLKAAAKANASQAVSAQQ